MTMRIEFDLDNVHAYRYPGDGDYALLLCHGGGGWGGMYDDFCYPYAEKTGADIWSWDAPGFGLSGTRGTFTWDELWNGMQRVIQEIRSHHDKPIIVLGSSMGGIMASASLFLDDVHAVVVQASPLSVGAGVYEGVKELMHSPSMTAFLNTPFGASATVSFRKMMNLEENYGGKDTAKALLDNPMLTDLVDLQSWASYFSFEPPYPLSENKKPFLQMLAERDPMFSQEDAEAIYNAIGGPKKRILKDSDKHQLMLFHTDWFCDTLSEWCNEQI